MSNGTDKTQNGHLLNLEKAPYKAFTDVVQSFIKERKFYVILFMSLLHKARIILFITIYLQ